MAFVETYQSPKAFPLGDDSGSSSSSPVIKIVPNRRQIDNRFPILGFTIQTADHPFYEVLLTTDRTLFNPANAGRRNASNFYASRQDSGLISTTGPDSLYLVPPAVLQGFAQAEPKPRAVFYTLIAYSTHEGSRPSFAQAPETLPDQAPSIAIASDFSGHTLSKVLGISSAMLQRIGAGAISLSSEVEPVVRKTSEPSSNGNGAQPDEETDRAEGEDGYATEAALLASRQDSWHGHAHSSSDGNGGWTPQDGYEFNHLSEHQHVNHHGSTTGPSYAASSYEESPGNDHSTNFVYEDGYEGSEPLYGSAAQEAVPQNSYSQSNEEPEPLYDDEAGGDGDFGDTGLAYDVSDQGIAYRSTSTPLPAPDEYSANASHSLTLGHDDSRPCHHPDDAYHDRDGVVGQAPYYDEAELSFESLNAPETPGSTTGAGVGRPLAIQDKKRIIERVAPFESSGQLYKAVNADGEFEGRFNRPGRPHPAYHRYHIGLSFGIVQFTQDSGSLGHLLEMMRQRDASTFAQIFGPDTDALIRVTNASGPSSSHAPSGRSARVQPVGNADLWQEPWLSRFRRAGDHVPFQSAQNELAAANYIEPILQFAGWLGLNTDRALTMIVDRAIQMGVNGAKRWIIGVVNPVQTPSQQQQALSALGHADLHAFQEATRGLTADGDWGPMTCAAMVGALRALGNATPIPIPSREQMMDALVRNATGRAWAGRVNELRNDPHFSDTVYEL
jgi:hypothetical protein